LVWFADKLGDVFGLFGLFFCLLFIIVYKVFWLFDYFFHLYVGWALVFGLFMLDFVSNMLLYLIFFFKPPKLLPPTPTPTTLRCLFSRTWTCPFSATLSSYDPL
jgi:hypothetical protein